MKEAYNEFNEELLKLRADKIELDVQLKNGDLRVILLFEELLLLKEFEKKENSLKDCLSSKVADMDDMSEKVIYLIKQTVIMFYSKYTFPIN